MLQAHASMAQVLHQLLKVHVHATRQHQLVLQHSSRDCRSFTLHVQLHSSDTCNVCLCLCIGVKPLNINHVPQTLKLTVLTVS